MNITVTGRGIEVTAAMRSYVEEKLQAATNVLDMPMEAETVLRVEHNPSNPVPQVVEVTVRVKGAVVRVSEAAVDMYAAIDLAADRVSRQLRKYKTRVVDRRQRGAAPEPAAEVNLAHILYHLGFLPLWLRVSGCGAGERPLLALRSLRFACPPRSLRSRGRVKGALPP